MKSFILSTLAVLPLVLSASALHADSFDIGLKTGATVDVLTETDITYMGLAAKEYSYTNETIGALGMFGAVLSSSTSDFTAIYAAVSPTAAILNVTDVCTTVYFLGSGPGCQAFSFSFTNAKLGDGETALATASLLAAVSANVGIGIADLNVAGADVQGLDILGLSIGTAKGDFNLAPPPAMAATPEPGSLCLLATGLATTAGFIRRKMTPVSA